MDDHKIKSNKKKTKKHYHQYESNGTSRKDSNPHGSHRKAHLGVPHTHQTHETFTTNGRIREKGRHELDVIVKARAFSFNPATNSYIMKLENVRLLAQNTSTDPEWIIFEIPPSKIHKTSQTQLLHEDDIDAILDEIEQNEIHHNGGGRQRGGHEYNRSLSYSQKRFQIKEDHLREESKQQIPTIQESQGHNNSNNKNKKSGGEHYKKLDSLRSIPPIPSITGGKSPTDDDDAMMQMHGQKRSFHKYRRDEQKMDRKKHELLSEWKRIQIEYKTQSTRNTACVEGARSIRNCICIERIKFVLFYYAKWVQIRTRNSTGNKGSKKELEKDNKHVTDMMTYYERITSFFEDLGYSSITMNDDFEHIREFHINNNSSLLFDGDGELDHAGSATANELDSVSQKGGGGGRGSKQHTKDRHETMEYFGLVLGSCDAKKCNILLRHCRDRDAIDNLEEMKRRKLFFHDDDDDDATEKKEEEEEEREIYFESKMDIIHCALLHQQTNVMLLNKTKFLTEIASGTSEEEDNEKDEMTIRLNCYGKVNKAKMSPFGESITYWDSKHHLYCAAKYSNLKEELLSNTLYSISRSLFGAIGVFVGAFLNSRRGLLCCVQREHDWMKSFKMFCGYRISADHCIALYCYTNLSVLRSVFVRNGYRHYFNHETVSPESLHRTHSSIGNWSRLLLECVHCFGAPFNESWRYYHGIDCKLLFDRFNIMIDIPSSLTLDKDFAYTFSSSGAAGIMIELNHGTLSDLQSLCFDNSVLSEFPLEEERFIFHSYVSVKDIVINGLHHDQWLKIFGFWYKLKEGFFFDHLISPTGITKNDQLCICAMIINMMLGAQNKQNNKYDQRIPYYMQCLFNECIQNKAFVWIIDSEYTHLAPKLKSLLFYNTHNLNKSSQFIRYLVTQKKCNVQKCQTFEWQIEDAQFESLLYEKNVWCKSAQYKIYLYFNKNYNVTHCLCFHFEVQEKPKNGLFRCRIHLDQFPQQIHKINLGVGIYVDKINVDNYSYAEIQTNKKLYNSSLHSLFKTKLLRKYHALNLKLQIQLFYLYDEKGKIIKFQPI